MFCINLLFRCKCLSGDWLLIHGASGGVGLAALQIAKNKGNHTSADFSNLGGVGALEKVPPHFCPFFKTASHPRSANCPHPSFTKVLHT